MSSQFTFNRGARAEKDPGLDALKNPFRLAGRFAKGAATSVDDLLRGIYHIGKAGYQDLEKAVFTPLNMAGVGGAHGRRVAERETQGPELIKAMGLSMANTVDTVGDLAYFPNRLMGRGHDEAARQAGERLQELNDDPFMFMLEHVGNTALAGSLAARPAQLGVAAQRGALTPTQAAKGLRPMAGRGERVTAREASAQAATEGSRAGQVATVLQDVVGHPYRAMGRGIRDSRSAGLMRNPSDTAAGLGPLESVSNEFGKLFQQIQDSPGYQKSFGPEARRARSIRESLRQGITTGRGEIGEAVQGKLGDATGNQNLRRRYDPSRVERMFLRDLRNLHRRPDAENYTGLIADLDMPITRGDRTAAGIRGVPAVASGKRAIGQTVDAPQLVGMVNRVLEEARTISGGDFNTQAQVLKDMLPGVDPQGFYLMGLNAVERLNNLPDNSLTSALGDFLEMDRFGELNRRAQQALSQAEGFDAATPERFRIPTEQLSVDLNALPAEHQRIFFEAAEQYRHDIPRRERVLVDEGHIPEAGTRIGRASNEPTEFPTRLEDLPLTSDDVNRLVGMRNEVARQRGKVDDVRDRLSELQESGRPLRERVDGATLNMRGGRVTQASLDNAWRKTRTGEAVDRWRKRLGEEREHLVQLSSELDRLEASMVVDPANAPASARNLMNYANNVAPQQAQALRVMAERGMGDPRTLRALADELDAIPRTLDDLNSSEVYLAYIRDVKNRPEVGAYGPGAASRGIDTRSPGRRRGMATDIDYSRDFRARAYWQDAEFQSYFMQLQADQMVHRYGLVKTGRDRLVEAGIPEAQVKGMSRNQVQQQLENLGYKTYHPDQMFPASRKPSPSGLNPLEAEWISPHVADILTKTLEAPTGLDMFLRGTYDKAMQAWKVFALPLRFGWQVNNYAGGAFLSILRGQVNPMDYPSLLRSSWRAVHSWNQGIPAEIRVPLRDSHRAELVAKLNTDLPSGQREQIQRMLDNDAILLDNSVISDISSRGLTRGDFAWLTNSQFLRDISADVNPSIFRQYGVNIPSAPARVQNLRQTGREFVDVAYHVNEMVDNLHRTLTYLDQIGKGATHTQAINQAIKVLGDYSKLSHFERTWVKRVYPFYPWMRHITEVTMSSLDPSNLQRAILTTHLLTIFGEPNEYEQMLPDYAQGHIYVGDTEDGTPKFMSTRGLNPFLDVFDPISQPNMQGLLRPTAPPIQAAYEKVSGNAVLTGQPFSSPTGDPNARPPAQEYLFRNIPQLGAARNVYRDLMDQPLTRYGTGEPAFFPGAEDHRSGMQSVVQLFGVNLRPMDVENMHNRERIQEYQREVRARRQQLMEEKHGGRRPRDLLEQLPGLGG